MTDPLLTRTEPRGQGSLNVTIENGPESVVCGIGLTTEQAVEEVCLYLPVCPTYEREQLRAALRIAADDLDKAANQFAGMRKSQQHGHNPPVVINPERFAEKAARARKAADGLTRSRSANVRQDEKEPNRT